MMLIINQPSFRRNLGRALNKKNAQGQTAECVRRSINKPLNQHKGLGDELVITAASYGLLGTIDDYQKTVKQKILKRQIKSVDLREFPTFF